MITITREAQAVKACREYFLRVHTIRHRSCGAGHQLPDERFDFALAEERSEVKAAVGRVRRHHFSLEQLLPIPGVDVLLRLS
jgi:hypothetical protein